MTAAVEFRSVDILFGSATSRRSRSRHDQALKLLDAGKSRAEISRDTGIVLGVADASLTVGQGQISVLMGLSGSGKSTLLRAANGLNRVSRGQVLVSDGNGHVDIATCDRATLRRVRTVRVAMVFQQFALLPWRTVRENVGFGLEVRGTPAAERRRIVDEKLHLVGLDQWGDRYASELSGGMQQRVGLARAFATDADILLMDEPFSALDPLIRTKLQDELLALQETVRKTILFVSHDLDEALKIGNQISILESGRIVQTGAPEDIVLRPADDYVAEFVKHMNPLIVLRAGAIMRPVAALARDGDGVWLDQQSRYRVSLDGEGRPTGAQIAGVPEPLIAVENPDGRGAGRGVAMVSEATPLRAILQVRQATGHPVMLERDGRLTGVCGEAEILRALCGASGTVPARVAAPA